MATTIEDIVAAFDDRPGVSARVSEFADREFTVTVAPEKTGLSFDLEAMRDHRYRITNIVHNESGVRYDFAFERDAPSLAEDLGGLFDAGCSPAEALDFFMTTKGRRSQREWAGVRGVGRTAVANNVRKAKAKLAASVGE